MTDKMRIWNAVCTTDPRHTKKVTQRGGFTAINAQYSVQRATEQFGPIGEGWGFEAKHAAIAVGEDLVAVVDLELWHGDRTNTFGPYRAMNPILTKGRFDDDAAKKALTDALTKGLSHLGFSADVFLGQYDDHKYVGGLHAQFGSPEEPYTPPPPTERTDRAARPAARPAAPATEEDLF